jgi:hypothetical protein
MFHDAEAGSYFPGGFDLVAVALTVIEGQRVAVEILTPGHGQAGG